MIVFVFPYEQMANYKTSHRVKIKANKDSQNVTFTMIKFSCDAMIRRRNGDWRFIIFKRLDI